MQRLSFILVADIDKQEHIDPFCVQNQYDRVFQVLKNKEFDRKALSANYFGKPFYEVSTQSIVVQYSET